MYAFFLPLKTIPNTTRVHDVPLPSPHYKLLPRTLFGLPVCWLMSKTRRTLCKSLFDFVFHDRTSLSTGKYYVANKKTL